MPLCGVWAILRHGKHTHTYTHTPTPTPTLTPTHPGAHTQPQVLSTACATTPANTPTAPRLIPRFPGQNLAHYPIRQPVSSLRQCPPTRQAAHIPTLSPWQCATMRLIPTHGSPEKRHCQLRCPWRRTRRIALPAWVARAEGNPLPSREPPLPSLRAERPPSPRA